MYQNVHVLLMYWKESNEPEFEKQLSQLDEVFKTFYRYNTSVLPIVSNKPGSFLRSSLDGFINTNNREGSLFIVYYGGHAELRDKKLVLSCIEGFDEPIVNWTIVQDIFLEAYVKADIFFILDCCHAGGSILLPKTKTTNVIDILAACSAKAKTPVRGESSLTAKLVEAFKANYTQTFDARYLYAQTLYQQKCAEDRTIRLTEEVRGEDDNTHQWFPIRTNGRYSHNIEFSGTGVKKPTPEEISALLPSKSSPPSPPVSRADIEARIEDLRRRQASTHNQSVDYSFVNMAINKEDDDHMLRLSEAWFGRYKTLMQSFMVTRKRSSRYGGESNPRCKVAILGTGIDLNHPEILQLSYRSESILGKLHDVTVENGDCDDKIGHGTSCAILLSKLASCEIFVAKVVEHTFSMETTKHVVEAVKWSEFCKVDIIILPLGMNHLDPNLAKAIEGAHSTGIVCLAASGNDGANEKLPFPARLPEVLAIYASDGYGNPAPFNPTPRDDLKNFSVLGQNIEVPSGPVSEYQGSRTVSGSAFAVTIAGGMLAAMFSYASEVLCIEEKYMEVLRSPKGAEKIFTLMSCKRGGYDYVAPWLLIEDMDPVDSLEEHQGLIKAKIVAALKTK